VTAPTFIGALTGNSSSTTKLTNSTISGTIVSADSHGYGTLSNYYSGGYISDTPDNLYGSLYNLGGHNSASSLSLQLYATANHNNTESTRGLWFRMGNNLGFQDDWKQVFTTDGGTISGDVQASGNNNLFGGGAGKVKIYSSGGSGTENATIAVANNSTRQLYITNYHGYGLGVMDGSSSSVIFPTHSNVGLGNTNSRWSAIWAGSGNFSSDVSISGELNVNTSSTGSINIISSGTSDAPNNGKLYISKTSNADWFINCSSGNDDYGILVHGNGTYGIAVSQHDAGYRARISYNGYIYSTDGLVHDIDSDERLKENVSNADSQWQLFKDLPLQKFKWIDRRHGENYSHGWIAQEVQEKYPDLVEQVPQPKEDIDAGLEDEEYLTVKTGIIQRLGLKALQEAMTKIETLEAKVETLEAQVSGSS